MTNLININTGIELLNVIAAATAYADDINNGILYCPTVARDSAAAADLRSAIMGAYRAGTFKGFDLADKTMADAGIPLSFFPTLKA